MVVRHEEDLTTPGKSAVAGFLVQRRPLWRCRAGMSSLYIVVGHARTRGAASCRLSSCLYGYCTAGWRDSFAQQRARSDFVTVRLNRATTTIRRRRNAIVARLGAHTHTRARARYTNTQHTSARYTLYTPGPVGDRHTTGARGHCTTTTTTTAVTKHE